MNFRRNGQYFAVSRALFAPIFLSGVLRLIGERFMFVLEARCYLLPAKVFWLALPLSTVSIANHERRLCQLTIRSQRLTAIRIQGASGLTPLLVPSILFVSFPLHRYFAFPVFGVPTGLAEDYVSERANLGWKFLVGIDPSVENALVPHLSRWLQ